MSATKDGLEALAAKQKKFVRNKNGLSVGLVFTQIAVEDGLPLDVDGLLTEEGGQVARLGKAAVQKILEAHGITKVLSEEGGRTSRGSIALMRQYVAVLNDLHARGGVDLDEALKWWIEKVNARFAAVGPKFNFDTGKSLRANIADLLEQAGELQEQGGGTNYVGAMLQHLVGAKLDLVLGEGKIAHHGFSVADQPTDRKGDFQIESVAIHVTTHPGEALIRKCGENLRDGLKPMIVTIGKNVTAATVLLENAQLGDRVDVLDALQFLTANVFERSLFSAKQCKATLGGIIARYNAIVGDCETDPGLRVRMS